MKSEKIIQQQAESALQHRTSRRGLFRGAGKGAAGLAIGGVAASLGALLLSSCYPGRSNAITGKPHAVLAARRDGYRDWNPVPYGSSPRPGVEWVKLQGDPASFFAQVGNPDRYAGDTYRTSQICDIVPSSTAAGPIAEVTAQYPGSYAIATKFQHKETSELIEEIHYVDVRPRTHLFQERCVAFGTGHDDLDLGVADEALAYAKDLGATFVSLNSSLDMPNGTSSDLSLHSLVWNEPYDSRSDNFFREAIDLAHARGLRVLFKLGVAPDGVWSGVITPDWSTWFPRYTELLAHFADIAEEHSVELFAVGNELNSAHTQGDRWQQLVADVRGRYSGLLTYADTALNYWPYETFPKTALLDHYGFNYWSPGSGWLNDPNPQATPSEMYQHMRQLAEDTQLADRLDAFGKPVFITEGAGLNPFDGLNAEPPTSISEGIVDEQEAVDYLEACYRLWSDDLHTLSAVVWLSDFTSQPLWYRRNDPRGRPIEEAIRLWYA